MRTPCAALRLARELVDAPEEGGKGLAGAGRGADQGVVAAGDRLPAPRLGRRRAGEGGLEPAPDRGAERRQRVRFRARFTLGGQSSDLTPTGGAGSAGGAAGEADVGAPGRLRLEALGEQAGAVAEVAATRAGRRPRTSRRAGRAICSPGSLITRKAPLSWVAWPAGPFREGVVLRRAAASSSRARSARGPCRRRGVALSTSRISSMYGSSRL